MTSKLAAIGTVTAKPFDELPLKTAKVAKLTEELHLADRSINDLGSDFRFFSNVECLWLNKNNLTEIAALADNFRIKILYLHENKINELKLEEFECFIALHTLTLNNNLLIDIDNTVFVLKYLRNLQTLDLFENPIAKEDNYRLRVIGELPNLTTLDRRKITDDERVEARELLKKLSKLQNFKLKIKDNSIVIPLTPDEIADNKRLKEIHAFLVKYIESLRITIDLTFLQVDKRKLGLLDLEAFWDCMGRCGLMDILSEDEKDLITKKYKKNAKIKSMSETGTLHKYMIDYRSFCFDVMPSKLCRLVPYTYKMEPVPEVSETTMDLERYVATVRKKRNDEETTRKKQTMLAASKAMEESSQLSSSTRSSTVEANGLDPWLNGELRKILSSHQDDGGKITKSKVLASIKSMEHYGKILNVKADMFVDKLPFSQPPEVVIESNVGKGEREGDEDEEPPVPSEPLIEFRTVGEVLGCIQPPVGSKPKKLVARWISTADREAYNLETKLFSKSLNMFDTLLRAGAKDDTAEIRKSLISTGISATRLASKSKDLSVPEKKPVVAMQLAKKSTPRADFVILPNLRTYDEEKNVVTRSEELLASSLSTGSGSSLALASMSQSAMPAMTMPMKSSPNTSTSKSKSKGLNNLTSKASGSGRTPYFIPEIPPDQLYERSLKMQVKEKSSGIVPDPNLTYVKGWNESTGSIVLNR